MLTNNNPNNAPDKIKLLDDWLKFKNEEKQANIKRLEIEAQLDTLFPVDEGRSKTHREEDYKVKARSDLSFKCQDTAGLIEMCKILEIDPPVTMEISTSRFKKLEASNQKCLLEEGTVERTVRKTNYEVTKTA